MNSIWYIVSILMLTQTVSLILSSVNQRGKVLIFGGRRKLIVSATSSMENSPSSLGSVRLRALVSRSDKKMAVADSRRSPLFSSNAKKITGLNQTSISALEIASGAALRAAALGQGRNETRFLSKYEIASRQAPEYANALIETAFGNPNNKISSLKPRLTDPFRRLSAEIAAASDEVDFCLSLADRTGIFSFKSPENVSITRRINTVTNILLRAASYGDADDVEDARQAILAIDTGSDDAARAYLDLLAALATSEERAAVTDNTFATFFYARGSGVSQSSSSLASRLGDAYIVALQRLLGELTRRGAVAGAGYSVIADDPSYLRSAARKEDFSISKKSGFSDPWLEEDEINTIPATKKASKSISPQEEIQSPIIKQSDNEFTSATPVFTSSSMEDKITNKKGVLGFNFIEWEMKLRRELVKRRAKDDEERALRPNDFVGTWQLVFVYDAPDDAGPLISPGAQENSDREAAVQVIFAADGKVKVINNGKNSKKAEEATWRVRPGPAHLDTCEFNVDLRDAAGESLATFCGYVDRGQRIESRFSKRPIRVSGFAYASKSPRNLDATPTGRFAMLGPVDNDRGVTIAKF